MVRSEYECENCDERVVKESNDPVLKDECPNCGSNLIQVRILESDTENESVENESDVDENKRFIEKQSSDSSDETVNPSKVKITGGEEVEPPEEIKNKVKEFYDFKRIRKEEDVFIFDIINVKESNFEKIVNEFKKINKIPAIREKNGLKLIVAPKEKDEGYNSMINVILFLITIGSTLLAGYSLSAGNPYVEGSPIFNAVAFSVSLLAILGTHEMGHKILSYKHNISATFPYFIPFPNIIGTMGAVIRMKDPIPTKDAAIDVGAAGPISGAIVAIPVTIIGLSLSTIVPASQISTQGGILFGDNLLFLGLQKLLVTVPEDHILLIHPIAIAGWVGLFVTSLNLMPVAQLDGGHIARVVLGERIHDLLSKGISIFLLATGLTFFLPGDMVELPISPIYIIWGVLLIFMSRAGHPGALNEIDNISRKRKIIALIAAILFIITFTPKAIWISNGF